MFGLFKAKWPEFSTDEIRKRSRLLVIDDTDFPYQALFKRDGYALDKWNDVRNLSSLERGDYDVILLDIRGVGRRESEEEGFGILKHLRARAPAQIVIAYSNEDWSLKYQGFFDLADARMYKSADYVDFKRVVDEQLRRRFSMDFYLERMSAALGTHVPDVEKLRRETSRAIFSGNSRRLEQFLKTNLDTADLIQIGLGIAQVAIAIAGFGR